MCVDDCRRTARGGRFACGGRAADVGIRDREQAERRGSARGAWTAELRRVYEPAEERRARAEEQLARAAFPNVKVTAVNVSDPRDIEKPVETRITATATDFASPAGKGLKFVPFGQRQSFVEAYAQLSKRSLPQRLPLAQRTVIEARVELPQGWTASLPEGASAVIYAYSIDRESGDLLRVSTSAPLQTKLLAQLQVHSSGRWLLGTFVADSSSATLRFTSTTPGTHGIVLDAVSLIPGVADTTPPVITVRRS